MDTGTEAVIVTPRYIIAGNRHSVREKILAQAEEADDLVLDFAKTDHIDLSGLGMLMRTTRDLSRRGKRLCLRNVGGRIGDLFELTKLNEFFTFC